MRYHQLRGATAVYLHVPGDAVSSQRFEICIEACAGLFFESRDIPFTITLPRLPYNRYLRFNLRHRLRLHLRGNVRHRARRLL